VSESTIRDKRIAYNPRNTRSVHFLGSFNHLSRWWD